MSKQVFEGACWVKSTTLLQANNSSGNQTLILDKFEDGTFKFTVLGTYREKDIQLDFDDLTEDEMRDLIAKLYTFVKEK